MTYNKKLSLEKIDKILRNSDAVSSLTKYEILDLLKRIENILDKEDKLIKIGQNNGKAVFVGDTHGDFSATKKVISTYLEDNIVVFLGDYVDRGSQSSENINYLLINKLYFPNKLFLLMGNHEARDIVPFSPSNFWTYIEKDRELYNQYTKTFSKLPLAVTTNNKILAVHGGLPDIHNLKDINHISNGDAKWMQITWMDFEDREGEYLYTDFWTGRDKYGEDYFKKIMNRLGLKILIRAHDYAVKGIIFNKKCLTLFTSQYYSDKGFLKGRLIAIVDLSKKLKSTDDIEIIKV
ncbi:MAG: metallophosphoesterase family protein [Methanosarcinales archaeon]